MKEEEELRKERVAVTKERGGEAGGGETKRA